MKKIIILLLSINLMLMAKFDVRDYGYYNFTKGGSAHLSDGRNFLYTPNFTFKFKNSSQYFTPWFGSGFPEDPLKIGCNGLSLDSMFGFIIGLKEIIGDLKKAATSAATGAVMMVLETSFPTLKRVSDSINKLARTLQGMLQKSCEMGGELAKRAGLEGRIKIDDSILGDAGADAVSALDSATGYLEGMKAKLIGNKLTEAVKDRMEKVGGRYEASFINGYDRADALLRIITDTKSIGFKAKKRIVTRRTGIRTTMGNTDDISNDNISNIQLLLFALIGDIGVDENAIKEIAELSNSGSQKEVLEKFVTGTYVQKGQNKIIPPALTVSKVLSIILDGSNAACNNVPCSIEVPRTFQIDSGNVQKTLTSDVNMVKEYITSDGLIPMAVSCLQKELNKIYIDKGIDIISTNYETISVANCNEILSVLPGYKAHLNVIAIEEEKNHKETGLTLNTKLRLANVIADFTLNSFFNNLVTVIQKKSRGDLGKVDNAGHIIKQTYLASVYQRLDTINRMLKHRLRDVTNIMKHHNEITQELEKTHRYGQIKALNQ